MEFCPYGDVIKKIN